MVLVAQLRRAPRARALLRLAWIDPGEQLIHIPAGVAKGGRDAEGRTTLVSDEALTALAEYRAALPNRARFVPFAFVNAPPAQRLPRRFLYRRWKKLERRVKIDGPWARGALIWSFTTLYARRGGEDAPSA